jgi:signal peptide peptidase SppA
MTGRYEHLVGYAVSHPWALLPDMCAVIAGILAKRIAGFDADAAAIAAARTARESRSLPSPGGNVAIIPLHGVIAPRMNLFSDASGGATFEGLTAQLRAAVDDSHVDKIVFDVDSPGGNVAGATEFAREVLAARAKKPVIAQANHLMASAAYWAMSGATEIVASPSSLVGGIGVYTLFDDMTKALDALGIKREVISAGRYKAESVEGLSLTDDARAHIQTLINGAYGRFTGDVGRGRGVQASTVRKGFGEGRVLDADAAKTEGLIDRIATMDETLARVTHSTSRGHAAETPPPATAQEPLPATAQEPAAAPHDADRIEFERAIRELMLQGIKR